MQEDQQLKCEECNKEFKLKRTLQSHKMIHTGEKPFSCTQCDQKFRQFSSLQKHERIHTGERPYSCEECQVTFTQISNLRRHEKKHSSTKPFKCEICGKEFITQQNCLQHKGKHQQDRDIFMCEDDGCGKTYLYKCSLTKHRKESHQVMQKKIKTEKQDPPYENYFNLQIQYKNLKDFFTCTHPQIFHQNHIDILFNGRLYNYNEDNGKIEQHELEDLQKLECDPITDHQHFNKTPYAKLDCSSCVNKEGVPIIGEGCCKSCKDNCQDCCLACNKGVCSEGQYPQSNLLHYHGPNCGHPIVIHNGHIDYLVNEILHYPHDGHCDNHGILNRISVS